MPVYGEITGSAEEISVRFGNSAQKKTSHCKAPMMHLGIGMSNLLVQLPDETRMRKEGFTGDVTTLCNQSKTGSNVNKRRFNQSDAGSFFFPLLPN